MTPGARTGGVTVVVKLEYILATEPGPGAATPQVEVLFKVFKVTFNISSSKADVDELVQ